MKGKSEIQVQKKETECCTASASEILHGVSEQIRLWRKRHEMTQAELANSANSSVSFISMIERAERSPSYQTLVDIARALDIPVSELFRTEGVQPVDDGYFRKLVDFAHDAKLSRKQVDQFIAIGKAVFELPVVESLEEINRRNKQRQKRS